MALDTSSPALLAHVQACAKAARRSRVARRRHAGRARRAAPSGRPSRASAENRVENAMACTVRRSRAGRRSPESRLDMFSQRIPTHALAHALLGALGTLASATAAQAQALPAPKDLVSGLDLECYRTPGPALNINLNLTHLN